MLILIYQQTRGFIMSIRVQHLTVQLSKRVFESDDFGIVRCEDMVYGVDEYNMKPLLILGVSYEQLPIHYRQYSSAGDAVNLEQFLTEFWNFKHENPVCPENPITGKPDVLIIDQRLENVLKPSFFEWLMGNGIQYSYSNAKSRKFSAVARQHQIYPDVKIEHHAPTKNENSELEKYKLTLENLNNEMKYQQFSYSLISKPLRALLSSSMWSPNTAVETVIEPIEVSETHIDPEQMSRHTQNDLKMYNPHWHQSSVEPYFQYGYLINNFVNENSLSIEAETPELALALTAMEYQWANLNEGIQVCLKQFKNKGYRNLDGLSQSSFDELMYRSGLSKENHKKESSKHGAGLTSGIKSFVYDISKMNLTDIAKLWKAVLPANSKRFELVPLLMEKKQKYRVFIAQSAKEQYVFVCSCRYKKAAAFDQGLCHGFKNGDILPMEKEGFNQLVLTALSGEPSVFDELLCSAGDKSNYRVA